MIFLLDRTNARVSYIKIIYSVPYLREKVIEK